MKIFIPKMYQKNVFNINYDLLKKKKIKMLIFDLDNTIVKAIKEVPENNIKKLIDDLKKDFKVVVASNNYQKRVKKVCDYLECDYLSFIMKPTLRIKRKIKKKYSYQMREICIIGDQLVTDIFVGNRCGIYTILVDPLSDEELKITSFNRFFEKIIKKKLDFKEGVYYEEE